MVYRASRAGGNLAWKAADGSGEEERLTESKNLQTPSSISPDGKWVAFNELKDIWLLPLPGPGRQPQRFLSHLILGSRSCVFCPTDIGSPTVAHEVGNLRCTFVLSLRLFAHGRSPLMAEKTPSGRAMGVNFFTAVLVGPDGRRNHQEPEIAAGRPAAFSKAIGSLGSPTGGVAGDDVSVDGGNFLWCS